MIDNFSNFLLRAERIEQEYQHGMEELAIIRDAGISRLSVGAGPVFHMNWIASLFDELINQFPNLKLELRTDDYSTMARRLKEGNIDIYLGMIPDKEKDDSIYSQQLIKVEHGIVMRKDNTVAKDKFINPSLLDGYRWVSFTSDPVTEKRIEQYTTPKGTEDSLIDIRTTSLASGIQLVKTGHFVMSAPIQIDSIFEKAGLIIRPVEQRMDIRDAGLHVRKSMLGSQVIQNVIRYFQNILATQN